MIMMMIIKERYKVNGGHVEHDQDAHDQKFGDFESLIHIVQIEAENQRRNIENLEKEKSELRHQIIEEKSAWLKLKNERKSLKQNFKQKEDKYLDDFVTLNEKLKDHDRVVFKMSQSIQTIHMLGTKPNSFFDPNIKTGLGYQNLDHLKKAKEAQPKLYNAKLLNNDKVNINLYDSEETLEEAKESRLKMKGKTIQVNYA
ncbi:hypothetical protein Tco_1511065, partial [Tanacetum coccineum]